VITKFDLVVFIIFPLCLFPAILNPFQMLPIAIFSSTNANTSTAFSFSIFSRAYSIKALNSLFTLSFSTPKYSSPYTLRNALFFIALFSARI
jgi:hypothetical protein